jgi:hypothetical protein
VLHPARAPVERRAERISAAAYGTVLVLAALAAIEVGEIAEGRSSELVLGVGLATWIAHLFSELLAEHVRHGEQVSWSEARRAAIDGSPILASTILPATILFLGRIDVLSHESSRSLAILVVAGIGIGVVALKVTLGH